ncbi:MAG TPA: COX15/CtaA family protein [Blastocatellia bacterium]|nr:COX15/CtaA family protein [Blastocatellia bacterium]
MSSQVNPINDAKPNRGLHLFAIFVAILTVVLLLAGALVTSNEAGDSVPDWPLSFGRWLIASDRFQSGVRYEYSHRFIAGAVGFATFILALWAWFGDHRKRVRRFALLIFVGVVAQGVLGGLRVLLVSSGLLNTDVAKPLIAVPHALIAQSFFGSIVAIAVFTSRGWFAAHGPKPDAGGVALRRLTAWSLGVVLAQLVLGAGFRHGAFGLLPHALGAVAVATMVAWTALATLRRHGDDRYLARPARLLVVLLVTQLTLGVLAYITRMSVAGRPLAGVADFFARMTIAPLSSLTLQQPVEPMISLTAAHLVVGALTLAALVVLALRSYQVLTPQPAADSTGANALASSPRKAAV